MKTMLKNRIRIEHVNSQIHRTVTTFNEFLQMALRIILIKQIHSILTFEMENKRLGCINRDNNAVINMIHIVELFLIDRTRLFRFRRNVKCDEYISIKDYNIDTLNKTIKLY